MIRGLESVAVIFLIFAVGFLFHYKKIWPTGAPSALSTVVIWISAPCLAVTSIVAGYDREMLASSMSLLLIAAIHMFALLALGKAGARALRLGGGRKTIFEVSFTFSNVIFIGLPINQIVFGEAGIPFLFAYYIISLACFWSFGIHQIAAASPDKQTETGQKKTPAISVRKILNPGFIAVLIGYALVQANIGLPSALGQALGYLANLTVPLSLLVIGANLTIFTKGIGGITKDEVVVLLSKFVISPLVMLGLLKLFGVTGMPFYVFLLAATMPCHMQTSILAQHYKVEPVYASKLVGLSTLLSIVTIPCYTALIYMFMK